jgi:hypothetical protein
MTGYILASESINEVAAVSAKFAAFTDTEKLQFVNSAIGEYAVITLNQGKDDYRVNTISGTALPTSAIIPKSKHFTALAAGTPHVFDSAFTTPFSIYLWGVKDGGIGQVTYFDENGVNSLTAAGFTAYPGVDGTEVYYIAIPEN